MLHRLVETVRYVSGPSGFDAYYLNLRRGSLPGTPSRGEARKDYWSFTHRPNFGA